MSLKQKFLRSSLALLIVSAPLAVAQPSNYVRGQVLVQFKPGVSDAQAQSALGSVGGRSAARLSQIGVHVVSLPAGANEEAVANALAHRPDVAFAELDRIVPPSVIPNDPYYANWEWHLQKISAPTAWNTTTGSNIIIAIIDTGVNPSHQDLASKLVAGWNFYGNNSDTSDVYGHGTAVAGTAAAVSNNGIGVTSICWGCWIMPIRVSDATGSASYSNLAAGLNWAADHGARVANISYIVSGSATVTSAAQYMQSRGGVTVSSAGNYTTFDPSADNPYILTVTGTDPNDVLYSWSNTGNNVDLAAPGCVYTTSNNGGYASGCGTSFSAPIVAGVAALVLSVNPGLTPSQLTQVLKDSADDIGPAGWDPSFGWGRVNAARAVGATTSTSDTTAPTVSTTSPGAGATVSGSVSIQASASDNVGVASVSFYLDGGLKCTVTAAPYACAWNTTTASNGGHTLTATAKDAAGNASSSSVSINVSNATTDTTLPTVSITSPAAGTTVSGTVSIQASAADNVGVASVSFYTDGALRCTATVAPYSCSWSTTSATNGGHTVTATARDAAGNAASASISVTVSNIVAPADTSTPLISITSPASGARVSGNLSITVNAWDNVGVVKVQLYVDGVLTDTATSAPWTTKWNTNGKVTNGSHTLQTRAYDRAGNSGLSPTITVYK